MNLRDLQYLVAVAEHLHFGKAALACHVSQPTLSMQLKKLEESLGVQLLERTNKQVMLTSIGRDIADRARLILADVSQLRQLAATSRDPMTGEVRMGLFPTLAPYLLPTLMPHLKNAFPNINFLLVEEKTPELTHRLNAGTLDCALLALPVADMTLSSAALFEEPFVLAVAATHRLAQRKRVRMADLTHETMLLLEDGHCLRDQALDICQTLGIGEANNFRATSLETLRHMVASSHSVTLMPKLAGRENDATLRYIPFAAPEPSRHIGLLWRKTSARAPLFLAIAEYVRKQYPAHL